MTALRASLHLFPFLRRWEAAAGPRLEAYLDDVGVWTIGFGSTRNVTPGMKITPAQAEDRLKSDVADAEDVVNALVKVPLSQGQFDALVSWTFNLGAARLEGSTLLSKVNANDKTAAAEIPRWCHEGKTPVQGLLDRRIEELQMYLAG